jgi:hypothetical protein
MVSARQLNNLPRTDKPMFWTFPGKNGESDYYVCNLAWSKLPYDVTAKTRRVLVLEYDTAEYVLDGVCYPEGGTQ